MAVYNINQEGPLTLDSCFAASCSLRSCGIAPYVECWMLVFADRPPNQRATAGAASSRLLTCPTYPTCPLALLASRSRLLPNSNSSYIASTVTTHYMIIIIIMLVRGVCVVTPAPEPEIPKEIRPRRWRIRHSQFNALWAGHILSNKLGILQETWRTALLRNIFLAFVFPPSFTIIIDHHFHSFLSLTQHFQRWHSL